jgi:DNA-directed RNA polymerase beta subunit
MNYKLTYYLIGIAVALLIVNLSVDLFSNNNDNEKDNAVGEYSVRAIDSVFSAVLENHGIEESWVSKKKLKISGEDSVRYKIIVRLPEDLPIPLILRDLEYAIENDITSFVSEEKKIFGETELRVYSNEKLKLLADIVPDSKLKREQNNLAFIFYELEPGDSEFTEILNMPYRFAVGFIPSEESKSAADSIKKYDKDYVVILNDDISSDYRIKTRSHKKVIDNAINKIVTDFSKSIFYLIDEKSELYNSPVYNYVEERFKKRGVKLKRISDFILLDDEDKNELLSRFKYYCEDKSGARTKIFLITSDNFRVIKSEFDKYRKKGYRIVPAI